VNSNISGKDLIAKVHDLLLPPLKLFCGDIPFNIHAMILRETGGGLWLRVSATDTPHFGNRFLKPPPRKKDAMPIFTAPTKPPIFGFFFEETVWNAIENRANVCLISSLHGSQFLTSDFTRVILRLLLGNQIIQPKHSIFRQAIRIYLIYH
jgi:hypothetical protein